MKIFKTLTMNNQAHRQRCTNRTESKRVSFLWTTLCNRSHRLTWLILRVCSLSMQSQ